MFVNHKLLKVSKQNKTGKIHGSKWSSGCRLCTRRHRCTSVYMKPPEEWHLLFILIFDSTITPTIKIITIIIGDLWVQWWRLHWILTQSKHNKHHNYHDLETRAVELIGGNWWCIKSTLTILIVITLILNPQWPWSFCGPELVNTPQSQSLDIQAPDLDHKPGSKRPWSQDLCEDHRDDRDDDDDNIK